MNIKSNGVYLDCTLGRAGHAAAICDQIGAQGRLIAIDRDPVAVAYGKQVFDDDPRVIVLQGEMSNIDQLLKDADLSVQIDGILMDLGVSSPQLDQAERGFSFMRDGELDMRMNPTQGESAAQWLVRVEEKELARVIFQLGEERFSRPIAKAIVEARTESPIETTAQLVDIVVQAMPRKDKHKHPATRTFQAIRLYINRELEQLAETLPKALSLLNVGGRLVVISFHSLEDRIVKRFMRDHATAKLPPRNIPVKAEAYQTPLRLIGRATRPNEHEVLTNPRSRSSVLRIAERTGFAYTGEYG